MNTAASLAWFKSSYSSNEGGDCVEVAVLSSVIHIRDSKSSDGPILAVSPSPWSEFLDRVTRD
ncbi:DUF397 domain-containing protein [Streptomyces sp. NPDC007901]|uniref:DUF397 domain-containing protein n=1 Tax=Streptomyces sp. NPDC007901 TaxID=3364785 RepID=UPI0036E9B6A0